MTRSKKRKRRNSDRHNHEDKSRDSHFGVAQALSLLQEPTSSPLASKGSTVAAGRDDHTDSAKPSGKKKRIDGVKTKYPTLTYVEGRL
jgi:RNA exonuclease 1